MRGIHWRTVLDRSLIAAAIIGGGLYANRVAPPLPLPSRVAAPSKITGNLSCSDEHLRHAVKSQPDFFVPTAPNEPMESLEN